MDAKSVNSAIARLETMLEAQKAGKFTSPNRKLGGSIPKRDFKDMPDDTIYASLPPENEVNAL